ncbi:MAG: sugar isomerase [Armatimonadetes bacterium]|nr:sugar isomerase [Armatimonadota bacterium]
MQPVLTYSVPQRHEATSWRGWGGVQTEADAVAERDRIGREMAAMARACDFPLEVLPARAVANAGQAAAIPSNRYDVLVIFAAGGWSDLFHAMAKPDRWNLMFLRHSPGPVYLWYEIAHPHFLRKAVDEYGEPGWSPDEVVVDRYDRLATKLRALHGLKRTLGKRILAIGGASGWGAGGGQAPDIARKLWKLDIVDYPYAELGKRITAAQADPAMRARADARAQAYLRVPQTRLETKRGFHDNAFLLDEVFRAILAEARTDALTVNHCMGTIMPMSKTTACMPLSLLNDDGYIAFCESDFVVIPSGILLHYISGKPVFLNDPTFPHEGIVTLAHCTAPRKMDGRRVEPVRILTHFESDYGAAPKVEMRKGQITTNLIPDFACKDWLGFAATVVANPFLDICRSQIDVRIHGDCDLVVQRMKGFHWMLSYGDYLDEVGYALKKLGVAWTNVSRGSAG